MFVIRDDQISWITEFRIFFPFCPTFRLWASSLPRRPQLFGLDFSLRSATVCNCHLDLGVFFLLVESCYRSVILKNSSVARRAGNRIIIRSKVFKSSHDLKKVNEVLNVSVFSKTNHWVYRYDVFGDERSCKQRHFSLQIYKTIFKCISRVIWAAI